MFYWFFFFYLALGRVSDQPLRVGERYIARRRPVALFVGDDLDFSVLPDAHARVRGAQVDTDGRDFTHFTGSSDRIYWLKNKLKNGSQISSR